MDIFTKKDQTKEEYLLAHTLSILQMKKLGGDKVQKIKENPDNM